MEAKGAAGAMTEQAQLSTDGFAARTALFYAASCILIGIHLPFFPVWLQASGFEAGEVGAILAATAFLRVLSVPMATHAADRTSNIRSVIIAFATATALGFASLGLVKPFWVIVAVTVFTAFAHTPAMALLDAYALRGLKIRGAAYGPVRLWGSVSFILANLGAGVAFDLIDARNLIWLLAASAISIAVVSLLLRPLPHARGTQEEEGRARPLWRDPRFVAVVVGASLVQSSHAVYYGFSTIAWSAAGYGGVAIGSLWALGVLAEIVLFACSGRLPPRLVAVPLLLLGAGGAAIRWTAMALDPPGWALPFLQCLHGLSFGATHLGAVAFIAQAAHDGRSATAQGYLSMLQGVTLSGCMLLAGFLYERVGVASYGAMAITALIGGAIALAAWEHASDRGNAEDEG